MSDMYYYIFNGVSDDWPSPCVCLFVWNTLRVTGCTPTYTTWGDEPRCLCDTPQVSLRERRAAREAPREGEKSMSPASACPYLGPARCVPALILRNLFHQTLVTVLLAPRFERCSHKAVNKKDICFNGLTTRERVLKRSRINTLLFWQESTRHSLRMVLSRFI